MPWCARVPFPCNSGLAAPFFFFFLGTPEWNGRRSLTSVCGQACVCGCMYYAPLVCGWKEYGRAVLRLRQVARDCLARQEWIWGSQSQMVDMTQGWNDGMKQGKGPVNVGNLSRVQRNKEIQWETQETRFAAVCSSVTKAVGRLRRRAEN